MRFITSVQLCSELKDRSPNWQRLRTKLTIKTAYRCLVVLKRSTRRPNSPVMNVSAFSKTSISHASHRRWFNIRKVFALYVYYIWNEFFEYFFVVLHIVCLTPSPSLYSLQNLVIPWPKHQARIISKSPYLVNYFLLYIFEESIRRRVNGVTEHEILKNHNSLSRCHLIKGIGLVLPASPHSKHVEIRLYCIV